MVRLGTALLTRQDIREFTELVLPNAFNSAGELIEPLRETVGKFVHRDKNGLMVTWQVTTDSTSVILEKVSSIDDDDSDY